MHCYRSLRLRTLLTLFALSLAFTTQAQYYWVYLKDKAGVEFDAYTYFDPHAIQRKIRHGVPVDAFTDYPVKQEYIEGIARIADSVGYASRWFNAVAVVAGEHALRKIEALPYVDRWEPSYASMPGTLASAGFDTLLSDGKVEHMNRQVATLGLDLWREAGIDGTGIRIAVFDGGFPTYKANPAFAHLHDGKQILHTWDFPRNRECVDAGISHGTMVLSCIGGMISNKPVGLATGASFLLAITEVRTEPFKEEQNWLAAAEWADKYGADIINSSLGYTDKRYFNYNMDGKTTFVTRAANMAASKGILVVNAAGNEGIGAWKVIGAPADADSVLSVGGLLPETMLHTSFSSYGPTFDKRMKPNVVAFGHVVAAGKKKMVNTQGTSFSSPLVAGFAACAWQTDRSMNNMQIFHKIEESGHLYPYFDYAHGFGIPQASAFLDSIPKKPAEPSFNLNVNQSGEVSIEVFETSSGWIKQPTDSYLYLHVRDSSGVLQKYKVFEVDHLKNANSLLVTLDPDETVCVHHLGYTHCVTHKVEIH